MTELSRALGRPATLDDILDAELDRVAGMRFDWVWIWMGMGARRGNPGLAGDTLLADEFHW